MRALHLSVGSPVSVTVETPSGSRRTMPFRVTSEISFPVLAGVTALGTGSATTLGTYANVACAIGPQRDRCLRAPFAGPTPGGLLVSVVPGARGQQAISHYLSAFSNITALPIVPTSLVNFGEAVNFPVIFGLFLAFFGAATMLHLLVVSVARRRRETGLLKALGFVRAQIAGRGRVSGDHDRRHRDRLRHLPRRGTRCEDLVCLCHQPRSRARLCRATLAAGGAHRWCSSGRHIACRAASSRRGEVPNPEPASRRIAQPLASLAGPVMNYLGSV